MIRVVPWLDALISVVLAPRCACCDRALEDPLDGAVCRRCWSAVEIATGPLCRTCGDTLNTWREATLCARCSRTPRVITMGRAIGPNDGALREILHALKYGKRRSVAKLLAERMAIAGADVLSGADLAVPVPLHFSRLYARGFNQAAEIARHIGIPVVNGLRRRRATVTQTDLPEPARFDNVRGAFALRWRTRVAGRIVVVVDDVSTTGATLDACARVLLAGGAKEVRGLTAARAASRLPV